MIDDNDFNKKSLHEAILYYFKENIYVNNNIIITDGNMLYFLRAKEFKAKLLENKENNYYILDTDFNMIHYYYSYNDDRFNTEEKLIDQLLKAKMPYRFKEYIENIFEKDML